MWHQQTSHDQTNSFFWSPSEREGLKKVADMSVNGGGGRGQPRPCPLQLNRWKRRKRCRMFWNVRICIWKDVELFRFFPLKIIRFWIYDMHTEKLPKKNFFCRCPKKTVFAVRGGGYSESNGHVRKYLDFFSASPKNMIEGWFKYIHGCGEMIQLQLGFNE